MNGMMYGNTQYPMYNAGMPYGTMTPQYFPQTQVPQAQMQAQQPQPMGSMPVVSNIRFISDVNEVTRSILPNGTAMMFINPQTRRFYIKAVDRDGMVANVETYEFRPVSTDEPSTNPEYVTKTDFEQFKQQLTSMIGAHNESVPASQPNANVTAAGNNAVSAPAAAANAAVPAVNVPSATTATPAVGPDGWPAGA